MTDIFDNIAGGGDIFDRVSLPGPEMLPAHTRGKAIAPVFETQPDPARNREVMSIATPAARENVQANKDIFDQIGKDVAGVVTKAGGGIVKGVTLGAVNPEKGTVGIPFTDKQYQVAPPLGEALQDVVGTSPEIAQNPYIGLGPEVAGTAAPWGVVSRGLSSLTNAIRGAVAGKSISQATEATQTILGSAKNVAGRVTHQATAGAIVGAAENISPEESRTERIAMTSAMGAGGQLLAEGIRGIAMAAGAAKQAAYQTLVDDLGKWAYGEKQFTTPEAANTWAAQTVTEIVQDAGGLKNMTMRQARRASAAVRNLTKQTEPVDVTSEVKGEVVPAMSEKPVTDVFDSISTEKGVVPNEMQKGYENANGQGWQRGQVLTNDSQPGEAPQMTGGQTELATSGSQPIEALTQGQPSKPALPDFQQGQLDYLQKFLAADRAETTNQPLPIPMQPETTPTDLNAKIERKTDITKKDLESLVSAAQSIRDVDAGKIVIDGFTKNASYSTREDIAPFYDPAIGKEKAAQILEDAANGKFPPQRNVAQWRLIRDAVEHNRELRRQNIVERRGQGTVDAFDLAEKGTGTEFSLNGEKFKVIKVEDDGFLPVVTVKDGEVFTIEGDESLKYDRGTMKKTEPQKPIFEGDQSKLFATPPKFGTKPQGKGTVSENPMYTEMKERKAEADQNGFDFSNTASGFADTGGYDLSRKSSIELPEIVEIAREISGGKYPHVLRKLGRRGALGLFKPGQGGKIEARADLFKTPGLAERVLAHEIGHLVDWLPGRTMSRGNILGRVASLKKYMKTLLEEYEGAPGVLTEADRARLRQEATQELKANARPAEDIIETITREVPTWKYVGIDAEMIKAIWNDVGARDKYPKLYRAMSEMSDAEKKAVLVQAMKGLVAENLQKFGERIQTGTETVTEQVKRTIPGIEVTPEQISKRYKELVEEEIAKRNLYKKETINNELKQLTVLWKPFDPAANPAYTKYRHSSPELYADALSVLINDPDYLKQIAPTFEKAFFSYLQRKPEVRDVYYDIQRRLKNPEAVQAKRVEEVYGMFDRGNKKRNEMAKKQPPGEKIKDTIMRGLVDERHDALKVIRSLEKQGGTPGRKGRAARMALEELPYISSEANEAIYTLQKEILEPAEAAGISKEDIGAFMFARRIIGEEGKKASALGHTAKTAQDLLDELQRQWGNEKFQTVQELVDHYRQIRMDGVIAKAREEKLFSPELMEVIDSSTDYSTNSVQKHLDKEFGGTGNSITAMVYQRVGSLDEIENPFVATVMKDLSILRAVAMNKAKRTTVAALEEAGAIQPAKMKYDQNFKRMMSVDPEDPQMGVIAYLVDGKPKFFYVAKPIAEGFKRDSVRAIAFARFIGNLSQPFRELFVSKNPAWMARNVARDFLTTLKNLPEVGLRDLPRLAKFYAQSWKEVWREAHNKGRSDTIRGMMEDKALPSNRLWESRDASFDDELDRIANSFGLDGAAAKDSNKAIRALRKVWDWLDRTGRASDLWGKVAAYKYLQAQGTRSSEEMARMARNRVGTPNVKRRGAWHIITNNLFMFSNVNKEGARAAFESAKEDVGAYAWKTFTLNILPRIILYGAAAGYAGDRMKKLVAKIPTYDLKQYNVIPLAFDKNEKAMYLALPQDYEGQFFGQLAWSLMNLEIFGKEGALNSISNLNPYREHPLLQIAGALTQYYLMDINPVDDWRGRNVLTDDQAQAGGKYAAEGLAKYAWNTAGGSMLYRFSPDMPEADASAMEKALKTFPMNSLGAYVKVSDRGISESLNKAVEPVKQSEARERIIARDVLKRMVEGEKVQLTEDEAQALAMHKDMVEGTLKTMTMRRQNRHVLEAILKAGSKRQKIAIIQAQGGN